MKKIALIAVAVATFALSAPSVFAMAAVPGTPVASHQGSNSGLYFLHELGISTSMEVADALWKNAESRGLLLSTWRLKVFGY